MQYLVEITAPKERVSGFFYNKGEFYIIDYHPHSPTSRLVINDLNDVVMRKKPPFTQSSYRSRNIGLLNHHYSIHSVWDDNYGNSDVSNMLLNKGGPTDG